MDDGRKMIVYSGLGRQRPADLPVRRVLADNSDIHMLRNGIRFLVILVCASVARCASSSAVPRPFPSPGAPSHHAPAPLPEVSRSADQPSLAGSWKLHWLSAGHPIAMAAATLPGSIAAASSGMSSADAGSACLARWQSSSGWAAPSARRTCNRAIWCSSRRAAHPPRTSGYS